MTSTLRPRLALLGVLAVLGVGFAVIGTTVGATAPLTASGPGGAFVVSEDNVTYEHGDQRATVINNTTHVDSIEIEQRDRGTYQVYTETTTPLTDSERSRAKAIVRDNATLQQTIQDFDRYELTVEPVRKLTVDSSQTSSFTSLSNTSTSDGKLASDETFTLTIEETNETGIVTIDRDPNYVEDEAVVRIRDPGTDEISYSARVALDTEAVIDITDWQTE